MSDWDRKLIDILVRRYGWTRHEAIWAVANGYVRWFDKPKEARNA